MKQITIKDIARMAGVSIATVSYVLNNKEGKNISDETRLKVIQVTNFFNYKISNNARNLALSKSYKIVSLYIENFSTFTAIDYRYFIDQLSKIFIKNNYQLSIVSSDLKSELHNSDAILILDSSREFFDEISKNNIIPVIGVLTQTKQELNIFFEIERDFLQLKHFAISCFNSSTYYVVSPKFNNTNINIFLEENFNVIFIEETTKLTELIKFLSDKNVIILGRFLHNVFKGDLPNSKLFDIFTNQFIETVLLCLDLSLQHTNIEKHIYYI